MPRLLVELEDGRTMPLDIRADFGIGNGRISRGSGVRAGLSVQWRRCGTKRCKNCPHGPFAYVVSRHPSGEKRATYLGALAQVSELTEWAEKNRQKKRGRKSR